MREEVVKRHPIDRVASQQAEQQVAELGRCAHWDSANGNNAIRPELGITVLFAVPS